MQHDCALAHDPSKRMTPHLGLLETLEPLRNNKRNAVRTGRPVRTEAFVNLSTPATTKLMPTDA